MAELPPRQINATLLEKLRDATHLTQAQLATGAEIDRGTVIKAEKGGKIEREKIKALATYFLINIDVLCDSEAVFNDSMLDQWRRNNSNNSHQSNDESLSTVHELQKIADLFQATLTVARELPSPQEHDEIVYPLLRKIKDRIDSHLTGASFHLALKGPPRPANSYYLDLEVDPKAIKGLLHAMIAEELQRLFIFEIRFKAQINLIDMVLDLLKSTPDLIEPGARIERLPDNFSFRTRDHDALIELINREPLAYNWSLTSSEFSKPRRPSSPPDLASISPSAPSGSQQSPAPPPQSTPSMTSGTDAGIIVVGALIATGVVVAAAATAPASLVAAAIAGAAATFFGSRARKKKEMQPKDESDDGRGVGVK